MDEFGVLVESIGFKGQRNNTPLADLKKNPKKSSFNDNNINISNINNLNDVNQTQVNYGGFDDVFGDFNKNTSNSNNGYDLDSVFGGKKNVDLFGQKSVSADDLFSGFDGLGIGNVSNGKNSENNMKLNGDGFDDLLGGFGDKSPVNNRNNTGKIRPPPSAGNSVKSSFSSAGDPFIVLEQPSSQAYTSGNYTKPKGQDISKSSSCSSVDEFDVFAMGGQRNVSNDQSDIFQNGDAANDLDSIFNMGSQSTNAQRSKATSVDPIYDSLFQNQGSSMEERASRVGKPHGNSTSMKKGTPRSNSAGDFMFFGEATSSSDVFQEVKGESEQRRGSRLEQHMRTQERMVRALAEKNQRDLRTQQEQEERHRIADAMNDNIKRWATGKEGNLRALLSSLQHVLWPECGWQPVSLTDLITSVSVKKVYHRATLCVHPDKVQQKGASVQQKYIAEKVFDLLKEAWNKFNVEELK